jgi:restriction system protein
MERTTESTFQTRNYYMVRANRQTDMSFNLLFQEGVVALGWSRVDVRALGTKSEVDDALRAHYDFWPDLAPQVRGRRENEIMRFNGIKEGDRIVVPYRNAIALATATGEHRYVPGVRSTHDLSNQVVVDYRRKDGDVVGVPRKELTEALARRLRVRGSVVANLGEFAGEIDRLFKAKDFTWQAHHQEEEEQRRLRFRDQLLGRLRSGSVHLEAGGFGLEKLVEQLLRLEGYDETRVLPRQTFDDVGDADVEASRADRFSEQKLLVQVKHHRGFSGQRGVKQLATVREREPEAWGDHDLVLVTTGKVSEEVADYATRKDVTLLDGDDLIDWLLDHVGDLDWDMQQRLGISGVPELVF